jgi:hypothetical protein
MVHIKSSGEYAWREDLYDRVGEQLGESTRSGAIDVGVSSPSRWPLRSSGH